MSASSEIVPMMPNAEADQQQALAKITIDDESQDHADRQHCVPDGSCCSPKSRKPRATRRTPARRAQENFGGASTRCPPVPSPPDQHAIGAVGQRVAGQPEPVRFSRSRDRRWRSRCSPRSASTPRSGAGRCSPRRSSKARRTVASVQTAAPTNRQAPTRPDSPCVTTTTVE